jgi:DNA adenine methylase
MKNNRARQLPVDLEPVRVRPPLKWAGSKYRILGAVLARLAPGRRLIEPFVGAGAVFLNSSFERFHINDVSRDLMHFYRTLKRDREDFIEYAARLFTPRNNVDTAYYELRDEFNRTADRLRKAAIFLYLNRHGYNGLMRYNSAGEFNVPFGRYDEPRFPEAEMLHFLARAARVKISSLDFETVMRAAVPGDVVYCDPPYVPLTATAYFTAYSAGGFSQADQQRLARVAEQTAARGIPVLISNHCTPFTERIYERANITKLNVRRLISCNSDKREHAKELLALFD